VGGRGAKAEGKHFFFEKKKQKTFTSSLLPADQPNEEVTRTPKVKVFWFFFSKKNVFLPSSMSHALTLCNAVSVYGAPMDAQAMHALVRFGLGRRGMEPLPPDPQAWLEGQLAGPDPAQFPPTLPSVADGLTLLREQRKLKDKIVQPAFEADLHAQTAELITTAAPFRERLVWFWANHFTVSTRQGDTQAVVGPFLREAIRPHVTGPFFDMLLAVMRHPAMLMYLDNANSVGPNSVIGQRQHRGLNENLARECLELHTLSPEGGYTQADVTAFAAVLTGWSVEMNTMQPGFVFRPDTHEPGAKTVMGQVFPPGDSGGILALDYLAHHPATYRHLATKLARHFVADVPPPEAVASIQAALHGSGGDLGAASLALTRLPQARAKFIKFRTPFDYVVAALRMLDLPVDKPPAVAASLNALAQPVWNAPLPNGWPDNAANWVAPEAMIRRIDWAYGISAHIGDRDPLAMADASLGPFLQPATRDAMRNAGSRRDALTLLLASPEFGRR